MKVVRTTRIMAYLICFGLLIGDVSAAASQANPKAVIEESCYSKNEYEMYQEMAACTDDELLDSGMTEAEIAEFRAFSLEDAFLERGKLPEKQLQVLGYTQEQIRVLKEYDGSPITDDSPVLLASATCTGSIRSVSASASKISFQYQWQWSTPPAIQKKDKMAVTWLGVTPSASIISVSATYRHYCVNYYSSTTGAYVKYISGSPTSLSGFNGYSLGYDMVIPIPETSDGSLTAWAKYGYMSFNIEPDGAAKMGLLKVAGGVGHASSALAGSVGVSASSSGVGVSISFTPVSTVSRVAYVNYTIKSDGSYYSN